MDGEKFRQNLIPSLTRSISYILASYNGNKSITYTINSKYLTVDSVNGNVYLVSKFDKNELSIISTHTFQVFASDGQSSISSTNTISIMDVNDEAPNFITQERVFQISEDTTFPIDFAYKNGSTILIKIHDPNPSNSYITLECQDSCSCSDVCNAFQFVKRTDLSTNQDWIGTLRILKNFNYIDKSIYQLNAKAKDDAGNEMNTTFIIKILPSLNKPPQLSPDCFILNIDENKQIGTLVSQLKLIDDYELIFGYMTTYTLVQNVQELNGYQKASNDPDLTQSTIDLANKYFQITNQNELRIKQMIDRDLNELTLNNCVIKVWIKISYLNKNTFSYEKMIVIINDLNDNIPKFGQYLIDNLPNYNILPVTQTLTAYLNENETGTVFFNNIGNNVIVAYDLDFGENASFIYQITNSMDLTVLELSKYILLDASIKSIQSIQSASNLNLVSTTPFDFESLNISPIDNFITYGVSAKPIRFNISAQESESFDKFQSEQIQVVIYIQDLNDNAPVFDKASYQINVDENISNGQFNIELLQFNVTDKDMGVYGIKGLNCYLRGDGSEKFYVDTSKQKIFLYPCPSGKCLDYSNKTIYDLTLICIDNNGMGLSSFSSVTVTVNNVVRRGFKMVNKIFYLLATGANKVEIPTLKFKPIIYDVKNRVSYTVIDSNLAKLFSIDSFGVFRIIANSLYVNQTINGNGTFIISILMSDSYGFTDQITVVLQLSLIQTYNRCPVISNSARCSFIFDDYFDKDSVRFCFYNATPVATDDDLFIPTNDPRLQQIIYSLSSDSPYYLDINPYDGCVKISPAYRLLYDQVQIIRYSIGVMNPGFPECLSSSYVDCNVIINKVKDKPPRCDSTITISEAQTQKKVVAYGSTSNSILKYTISSEERYFTDGSLVTITDPNNFFYTIDLNSGLLTLKSQSSISQQNIISIIVTVNVQDVFFSSPLSASCQVGFRYTVTKNPLIFIGSNYRSIDLCEDVPVNSPVITVVAFDTSFSSNTICYTLFDNSYFGLVNGNNSSNGTVILKNQIDYEYFTNSNINPVLNFTSKAYFCNEPNTFTLQTVLVKILNVNEYAPMLEYQQSPIILSLNSTNTYITKPLIVQDYDSYPFNKFECSVQNDYFFRVLTSQTNIIVSYIGTNQVYTEYVDLAIKCCDDLTNLSTYDLSCSPIKKCSMTPVRVQFTNYMIPVYCANVNQNAYVAETLSPNSDIISILCVSNNTKLPITYEIQGTSNIFIIDKKTGIITLTQPLMNTGISNQQLAIKCSNGLASDTCSLKIDVVSVNDTRPVWIAPDINSDCIEISEDSQIGSILTTVRAVIKSSTQQNENIKYYFISNNILSNSIYEFTFKNISTGEIILSQSLNRNVSKFREITLAARLESNGILNQLISYQYLCVNITAAKSFQPCFRKSYNQTTSQPYKIYLDNSNNNSCFISQPIRAINIDNDERLLYFYYLISVSNNQDTNLLSYFTIDNQSGQVCASTSIKDIINGIIDSTNSNYIDELGNICYDYAIMVSKIKNLTLIDLKKIIYNKSNCSFTLLSVCFSKNLRTITGPKFLNNDCRKILSLNSLSPVDSKCLSQFQIDYSLYDKSKTQILIDNNAFKVDNSTKCLYIDNLSGLTNSVCGSISLNASLSNTDINNIQIYDWLECKVYLTKKCEQEFYVSTTNNARFVVDNLFFIQNAFSTALSSLFRKNIIAIIHKVLERPSMLSNNDILQGSNSFILISFYDEYYCRFLEANEILNIFNPSLSSFPQINSLLINNLISSCPISRKIDATDVIVIVILWSILLLLLLLLIFCLTASLCYAFKKLKYKNDRIVLREQVIPLVATAMPLAQQAPQEVIEEIIQPEAPLQVIDPNITLEETVQPLYNISPKLYRHIEPINYQYQNEDKPRQINGYEEQPSRYKNAISGRAIVGYEVINTAGASRINDVFDNGLRKEPRRDINRNNVFYDDTPFR